MEVEIEAVKIMVDNQSTIMPSKTSAHRNITKYIDTRYHFIRDCVEYGRFIIEHMKIEDQLANILTKAFGRVKFGELSARIGIKKAWDKKKIKEENMGGNFPTWCMASVRGTTVARKGEHPARTQGAHSVGAVAPIEQAPRGVHWHTGTSASVRQ